MEAPKIIPKQIAKTKEEAIEPIIYLWNRSYSVVPIFSQSTSPGVGA